MKTTSTKIKGYKIKKEDNMDEKNSYDFAFQLSNTLRLYQKRFADDQNITIYPSSWYDGFFEITIRNKYNSEEYSFIDLQQLLEILKKHRGKWSLFKKSFQKKDDLCGTPVKLHFKYNGEN